MVMTLTNTETELEEVKCDVGDRAMILPQNDPSPVRLHDMVKRNRKSSERQKPLSNGIFEQPKDGSTIVFCEVTVTINDKTILKRVSGMAMAGEILAIMGPSGAGKSTLLSVMAGRIPVTSGHVSLNGQPVTKSMRREISHVPQTDCFYPILTLREMLTFVSLLRLTDSMPMKLKMCRMLEIVDTLDLNKCLDTKIGTDLNFLQSGLSGGERKRASIACELITNPRILLIDEPTSGLDSAIAHDLMSLLTKLSTQQRKTIVTTIHQPTTQIFNMFSKVLLLVEGEVAYFGSGDKISDFFADIGLSFDPLINPAEFIMEQIRGDHEKTKMINATYVMRTREDWPQELRESAAYLASGCTSKSDLKTMEVDSNDVTGDAKWPTGFWTQYTALTRRSFILSKDRFLSLLNLVHVVNMFLVGMEWFQLPRTESTINDRFGLLFFISITTQTPRCFGSLFLIYDTWGVFETERSAGIYRLSAYYLGTLTAEAPSVLVLGVCYGITCYWVTGLTPNASCFFYFLLILVLGMFLAQSLGILIGVLVHRRDFAASIASTVYVLFIMAAGFYNAHTRAWFDWIRYILFFSYIWSSMIKIEFILGDELQCNPANSTSFPEYCTNGTTFPGPAFLSKQSLTNVSIYVDVTLALCNLVVFHVAAYLFLRFLKPRHRA